MKMQGHFRFLLAAVLLAVTAGFLYARDVKEVALPREALAGFPHQLGTRNGADYAMQQEVLDVLGHGDFLLRNYPDSVGTPDVDLFVAYFASQRAGDTLHSPKNCLPGAGWSPVQSKQTEIRVPGASPFKANEYLIAKGSDRRLVLYWYQAHSRAVGSEYWAKFYLIADAMRYNRSDGSLIRMTTAVVPGERVDAARVRLMEFAGQVVPLLDRYIPR
jgi:EpsI family protein